MVLRTIVAFHLLLISLALKTFADDTDTPTTQTPIRQEETISTETLRAILRIEDELRSNHLTTAQSGREAREAAARNTEVFTKGLQTLEEAFSAQQQALSDRNVRELQVMQNFNRVMLIAGGTFTLMASVAILMVGYFQWRTSKAWTEILKERPGLRRTGNGTPSATLESVEASMVNAGPVQDSSSHLLKTMQQLELRLKELEQSTGTTPGLSHKRAFSLTQNGDVVGTRSNGTSDSNGDTANGQPSLATLLGQGQERLKANDWDGAVKCFDEVLALQPSHGEALVRKGSALERLGKLDEAFECYEQAIVANDSTTLAYLHKGGLYSRLERFKEALECYEKALHTHAEYSESSVR